MDRTKAGASMGVAALLGVVCGGATAFMFPAALTLPMLGIYYGVRESWHWAAGLLLTGLIVVQTIAGTGLTLIAAIFSAPVTVVGIRVLREKWHPFEAVAMCIGTVFAGLMLSYFFANAFLGGDAIGAGLHALSDYLLGLPRDMYERTMGLLTSGLALSVDLTGARTSVVAYVISQAEVFVRAALPTLVLTYAAVGGLITFAFSRKRLQTAGADVIPMVPFWDYQLPTRFARGAIFIIMLGLIAQLIGEGWVADVGLLSNTMFLVCFIVQGFAVIDYYLVHRSVPQALRWLVLVVAYLLFGSLLFVVGVLDQVLGIRTRIRT